MKHTVTYLLALLFTLQIQAQTQLDTTRIQGTGFDGTVAISTDDAEQINSQIDKLFDDDLDMGWEGDEFNVVVVGLRFRGIDVPKNAVIDSAFVEIWAHEDEGDPALITIRAEASDNAETYNDVDLITARPYGVASVFWQCTEDWTIWTPYRTPELKTLIQEVINRPGWASGNALALMFTGQDQGASTEDNARDIMAFENIEDPDDGGDGLNHPERIPKLFIYWRQTIAANEPVHRTELSVAPNPVHNGVVMVHTAQVMGADVVVALRDLHGRTVANWQFANLQQDTLRLQVGDVPTGLYVLEMRTPTSVSSARIVVR